MTIVFEKTPQRRSKILLAEDEQSVRRAFQLSLTAAGFDVRAFGSGAMLLADTASQDADCLVTDLNLGDNNGIELLTSLRARGWRGPALLVTGSTVKDIPERAKAAGFAAVLIKPILGGILADAVARVLPSHRARGSASAGVQA